MTATFFISGTVAVIEKIINLFLNLWINKSLL